MQKIRMYHGFTLIELIIVVVIIGVLITAIVPRIIQAQGRARDSARDVGMRAVSNGLEVYALDHNDNYPVPPEFANNSTFLRAYADSTKSPILLASIQIPEGGGVSVSSLGSHLAPYMKTIPLDVGRGLATEATLGCIEQGDYYAYFTNSSGTTYAITSVNESKKGNTNNCGSLVNKIDDGIYKVIGKGLLYMSSIANANPGYNGPTYNGTDNPSDWCAENITDEEIIELGNIINTNPTRNDMCRRNTWASVKTTATYLPQSINKLVQLQGIIIQNTAVTSLPPLNNLKKLAHLQIGGNQQLSTISIYDIPTLTYLELNNNKTATLTLTNLPKVTQLHFSNNQAPTTVQIDNLPDLQTIYMDNNNQLTSVSITNTPKLQHASFQNGNMTTFPSITNTPQLQRLYLENNHLSSIIDVNVYPALNSLTLTNNNLTSLSPTNCTIFNAKGWTTWFNGVNLCP